MTTSVLLTTKTLKKYNEIWELFLLLDIRNASLSDKNTTYTPCIKKTANDSRKIKREIEREREREIERQRERGYLEEWERDYCYVTTGVLECLKHC